MLHLPALGLAKQIDKAFKALQKINLVVRGLYGEGSRALGDFFQISNQITLGKSEVASLSDIRSVIQEIIKYERMARSTLMREARQSIHDKVARALGTLQSATMMTSEETMELLSAVRLGVHLKLVGDLSPLTVNELFIHTQPAHLQKLVGEPLDGEARNAGAARYPAHALAIGGCDSVTGTVNSSSSVPRKLHAWVFVLFLLAWTVALMLPVPHRSAEQVLGSSFHVFLFAKGLHVCSYAFLATLGGTIGLLGRRWFWVFPGLILHGCLTEFFQQFVGRGASIRDVGIDTIGISIGSLLVFAIRRIRRRRDLSAASSPAAMDRRGSFPPNPPPNVPPTSPRREDNH